MVEITNKDKPCICQYPDCQKKIRLTDFACKCANIYCKMHRLPEHHRCTYDYREIGLKAKRIEDLRCISDKIQKIDS